MRDSNIRWSYDAIPKGYRLQICVLEDNEVVGEVIDYRRLGFKGSKKLELLIRLKKIVQVEEIEVVI